MGNRVINIWEEYKMSNLLNYKEVEKLKSGGDYNHAASHIKEALKELSKLYFDMVKNETSVYIPPSGKVLDENELYNMIEASLDMWLTTGRFNERFETKLSQFLGVRYALTTNSGSSANLLAISALTSYKLGDRRLREGDEVITVAAGFPTTVAPIIQNKLVPVFVDVELGTYNIDVNQIEESITEKTKAIFVAHTLGNPFDVEKILHIADKYNLWLIEDNCDALGSKYNGKYTGSFGHISTLSFYPAHHITMGEGGAVLTNDYELYKIIMSFRDWGRDCWCPPGKDDTCKRRFKWSLGKLPPGYDHKYIYSHIGYNLKITDWQAAIGLAQLDKLQSFIEKRKRNFEILYKNLSRFSSYFIIPKHLDNSEPSWFGFPITVKEDVPFSKFEIVDFLEQNRIGTRQLFAGNLLKQPAFTNQDIKLRIRSSPLLKSAQLGEEHYSLLPNTDYIMKNTFWIGVWPGLDEESLDYMIKVFEKFIEKGVSK
ncbi:MAG: lipopolysaccharide biosynthesis protein RfbH [Hydrogenothermaceae bacterium]|nr:lipopolysaccharide biosynthesis protein RfbH [Hydrogenothermaceae bacterium]